MKRRRHGPQNALLPSTGGSTSRLRLSVPQGKGNPLDNLRVREGLRRCKRDSVLAKCKDCKMESRPDTRIRLHGLTGDELGSVWVRWPVKEGDRLQLGRNALRVLQVSGVAVKVRPET